MVRQVFYYLAIFYFIAFVLISTCFCVYVIFQIYFYGVVNFILYLLRWTEIE